MTANIAAASPRRPAASRCPPARASGKRCLPRCPRGPRRMGWPGQLGAVGVTWAAGGVQLPEGPRVTAFSIIRQSYLLLSLPSVYSLLLPSRRVLTSPDRVLELDSSPVFLACGMPGGSRAMPSPYQGTLACPKPGTPGDFSPACDVDDECRVLTREPDPAVWPSCDVSSSCPKYNNCKAGQMPTLDPKSSFAPWLLPHRAVSALPSAAPSQVSARKRARHSLPYGPAIKRQWPGWQGDSS